MFSITIIEIQIKTTVSVSPHTSQSGHHQKIHKQMLERMWGKGNSHSLLVGMQNGRVTLEAISYRAKHCHTT